MIPRSRSLLFKKVTLSSALLSHDLFFKSHFHISSQFESIIINIEHVLFETFSLTPNQNSIEYATFFNKLRLQELIETNEFQKSLLEIDPLIETDLEVTTGSFLLN
ncbi:hypothetical protein BpHYR1_051692 [Brachionus plicatilis]|uniref:Uncharacterized protein n=1 Tax=Brachionus plicatilis TaxID=10195 RepID=A0A3M7R346_BRAPC|nr:hypothetical protein BpHYR1_051692 [Brachionus plicatilis]